MARARLQGLENSYALRSPERIVRTHQQRLDELGDRLALALRNAPAESRHRLDRLRASLDARLAPFRELRRQRVLDRERRALDTAMLHVVRARRHELDARAAHLAALNPRAILKRGYSITYDAQGRIVLDSQSVKTGEEIRTVLGKGEVRSRVEDRTVQSAQQPALPDRPKR
jgi:exodeoxyribonuclease VII large subunit